MDNMKMGEKICHCRRCNGIAYVVRKGDTIYNIAGRFGITVNDILNENRFINVYNLQIGDKICIPVMPQVPPYFTPSREDNRRRDEILDEMNNNMNRMDNMNDMNRMNDMNNMDSSSNMNQTGSMRNLINTEIDFSVDGGFEYNELERDDDQHKNEFDIYNSSVDGNDIESAYESIEKRSIKDVIDNDGLTIEEFVNYIKRFDK